jgi:hypothetical protein
MTDSEPTHARMTHLALRSSASSGSPLAPPKASPASEASGASAKREILDLLGHARPRSHADSKSII